MISYMSSIETLVNFEYNKEEVKFKCQRCKDIESSSRECLDCGKPIWGISVNFNEFLSTFVSSSADNIKLYKKLYSIRSKIAHTDFLLVGDKFLDWDLSDKSTRFAIFNYLLSKI